VQWGPVWGRRSGLVRVNLVGRFFFCSRGRGDDLLLLEAGGGGACVAECNLDKLLLAAALQMWRQMRTSVLTYCQ